MATVLRNAVLAAILMVAASVSVAVLTPKPVASAPDFSLDALVPQQFGDWRVAPTGAQVVNPQTQELLDKLYSQTLSRTYVNARGERIMLSIAYGSDQRGGLQAHMPDVCYPAQGFNLVGAQKSALLVLGALSLPVQRLHAQLGAREEPITYWFTFGSEAVTNATPLQKRLIGLRFTLTGVVPDGILVRVSSIEPKADSAYERHDAFIRDMLGAMSGAARLRLAGTAGA